MFVDKETRNNELSDRVEEAIRNGWSVMIKTAKKDSYIPIFIFYRGSKTQKLPAYDFVGGEEMVS